MLIANWHEPVEIPAQKETLQLQQIAGTRGSVPTDGGAVIADKFTPAARSWRNYSVSGAARQRDGKAVHTERTRGNRAVRHVGGARGNRAIHCGEGCQLPKQSSPPCRREPAATKRQPTPEAPSVSASEPTIPFPSAAPKSPSSPSREPVCSADKWEQLCTMYPEIHPFRDSREYLSIAPKDFVVLCKEYQRLVHNSFLLHGYYNYRHLILGRIRQKDAWQYYIGVPGNFYDREKMVAEMFDSKPLRVKKNPHRRAITGII